jgi:uncharacterized membrane protein
MSKMMMMMMMMMMTMMTMMLLLVIASFVLMVKMRDQYDEIHAASSSIDVQQVTYLRVVAMVYVEEMVSTSRVIEMVYASLYADVMSYSIIMLPSLVSVVFEMFQHLDLHLQYEQV